MTEEEIVQIEEILTRVLQGKRRVPEEQHYLDHVWAKRRRDEELKYEKYKEWFIQALVGTLAIGGVGILAWIGKLIIEAVQHGNLPGGN